MVIKKSAREPMIEAAYHNLDGADFWDRKPVYLGVDAGGARARRAIQSLLAKERLVSIGSPQ